MSVIEFQLKPNSQTVPWISPGPIDICHDVSSFQTIEWFQVLAANVSRHEANHSSSCKENWHNARKLTSDCFQYFISLILPCLYYLGFWKVTQALPFLARESRSQTLMLLCLTRTLRCCDVDLLPTYVDLKQTSLETALMSLILLFIPKQNRIDGH